MSLLAGSVQASHSSCNLSLPQPALVTLLSSTSKPPLSPLWTVVEGPGEASFVQVLRDTEYPGEERSGSAGPSSHGDGAHDARHVPRHAQVGSLPVPVIHMQSPRPDTYICSRGVLGISLPYLGAQVKPLGRGRGMAIEVEVLDAGGRRGCVRLSSWKKTPTLHASRTPMLLHLPLALPNDSHKVTDWAELSIHLPSLVSLFRTLTPVESGHNSDDGDNSEEKAPQWHQPWRGKDGYTKHQKRKQPPPNRKPKYDLPGPYASTASVRVYASCRLRRVWFTAEGDKSLDAAGVRDEWALYGEVGEDGSPGWT